MFIKKIQIENFKCFENETLDNLHVPTGEKGSGLNILIGENNSGKTAIFSIFPKLKNNSMISNEEKNAGKDVIIKITSTDDKIKVIKNIQGGSHVDQNESGESGLKYEDFDLIKDNRIWMSGFNGEMAFEAYQNNSNFVRSHIDSHLSSALSNIEKNNPEKKQKFDDYMKIIMPQFSEWTIEYSSLAAKSYISYKLLNGSSLNIDDSLGGGILNLFRIVLSFVEDKNIIVIDEPEAFLHPIAQSSLLNILLDISKDRQIFISTHSPYMFKGAIGDGAKLLMFKREDDQLKIVNASNEGWGLFGRFSPTWGEINWFAYDLPTVEFHNELFGYIERNSKSKLSKLQENKKWLDDRKLKGGETAIEKEQLIYDISLQGYIRHSIHHPENTENEKYSDSELKQSTQEMIKLLDTSR